MWKNIEIINPITGEFDANNFQMELNNRLRYYFSHIDLSALSIGSTGSLSLYQISATTANLAYISSTGSATLNLFASSSGRIGQLSSTGSATFNTLASSSATIGQLGSTGSATFNTLASSSATIGQLGSTGSATFNTLASSSAILGQISSTGNITANTLSASSANFTKVYASSARFGNSTSYSEFEDDGTLAFSGDAVVWEDANFNSVAAAIGVSAPDLISFNGTNIKIASLDGNATNEELSVSAETPHKYKEGTDLIAHVHWCPTSTAAGTVRFYFDYALVSSTGIITTGTFDLLDSATGAAWTEKRLDLGTISGTSLKMGQQGLFRLYRIPSSTDDTYGDDIGIFTFGYHHQIDTIGSRTITSK